MRFAEQPLRLGGLILAAELPARDGEGGLRGLWRKHEEWVRTVSADDEGVRVDPDAQADYRTCREKFKRCIGG